MNKFEYDIFLSSKDVKEWSKKNGYNFYVDIFQSLSVEKKFSDEFVACVYDVSEDEFVNLIKKSIKENKDYIAPYVQKSTIPDGAII